MVCNGKKNSVGRFIKLIGENHKIHFLSSLEWDQIPDHLVGEKKGMKFFQNYLKFAKTGKFGNLTNEKNQDDFESGFEESVCKSLRSLGYEGFDAGFAGFLLWSGSALPGQTSNGQPYSGVGLELYANTASYFRYSTTDSIIDVRTDKFFFGNPNTAFISGSNGLIEISSSKFHLTNQGNLTASNALFSGNVTAVNFSKRVVTVTDANSGSYLRTVTGGKNLVFNGSLGGQIIADIAINTIGSFLIKDIELPNTGSNINNEVNVYIQTPGIQFDNSTIGPTLADAYAPA